MPPKAPPLLSRQSLKAAVWYTVSQIATEEETTLGISLSEHFVAALSEVVFTQALSLGKDLESFAVHANRTTIGVEDVKLAARRNDALYELICSEATKHGLSLAELATKSKPRARPAVAKPRAKAKPKEKDEGKKGKGKAKAVEIESGSDEDLPPPKKAKVTKKKKIVEDSEAESSE